MQIAIEGSQIVPYGQYESSLQVSGEFGLLSQSLIDFSAKEEDDSISVDEASVSEFEEEDDIANKEDYVQTEEVGSFEANKEKEKKDELYIGMEFSSDESAHIAYKQYGGNHGFNVRKQRRTEKKREGSKASLCLRKKGV